MKKLLSISLLALLLAGCSAQQRLSRIMEHHPELRTGDSVRTVLVEVPIEAAYRDTLILFTTDTVTRTDTITIHLDSLTCAELKTGISVTEGHAKASVRLTDSGLQLRSEQLPDTIKKDVDVHVPQYECTIKQTMSKTQNFFYYFGICSLVLFIIAIIGGVLVVVLKIVK